MEDYKISLGIDLDEKQLNTVKTTINNLVDKERKINLDIDFNIKNASKLTKVGEEIENIKSQLKELNNIGSTGKGKSPISIDSKSLETSLGKIHDSIKKLQNAFGKVDKNKGVQSLLTTVSKIGKELANVSKQFEGLNKNLTVLSSKDFNFNLDFGLGSSGKKDPTQLMKELRVLEKEAREYEKYIYKVLNNTNKVDEKESRNSIYHLANRVGEHNSKNYLIGLDKTMTSGADSSKIAAYKEYIRVIKELASIGNITLSSVEAKLAESSDFVKVKNEANETKEALRELFSGGINAEKLHQTINDIAVDLGEIKKAFESLSSLGTIDGLTNSFKELSEVLDKLVANVTLAKNTLENGFGGTASVNTGAINNIEKASDDSTATIIQNEKKKQEALKQTQKLISDSAQKVINDVSSPSIDKSFRVNDSDSNRFKQEMENLVSQWTNAKGKLTDIKIDTATVYDKDTERHIEKIRQAQVTYNNELGETIKKTIAWRQIGTEVNVVDGKEVTTPIHGFVEVSGQYSKALGKTKSQTDNFVKQQKNAVSDLTNTINQLNRATSDQNAPRPIKNTAHLEELERKYKEVISTIQRMESASDDNTFQEERNNVKRLISEYKSLTAEYKNAENVSTKMKGTDFASGLDIAKNDLEKFKAQAKGFPQITDTVKNLDRAIEGVGDAASLNKFNDQLRIAKSELAKVKTEVASVKKIDDIKFDIEVGTYDTEIFSLENDFEKLSNKTKELKTGIELVKQQLTTMKSASTDDELISSAKEYERILKDVENQLKKNQIAEQKDNDNARLEQERKKLSLQAGNWLKDNSAAAKDFGNRIRELQAKLKSCNSIQLDDLKREFQNIKQEAKEAGKTTKTFGDSLKTQFAKYSSYFSIASLFMYVEQGLRSMFEQVKLIDSAMTELKKVTDETDASYNKFLSNAASRSREIGTTIDGLVSSTADFARLGYGFEDAQGLAEVANIYAVVGDEINGVEGATESLISTMAAFKDEMNGMSNTDFAMSIIDKFNEIGKLIA